MSWDDNLISLQDALKTERTNRLNFNPSRACHFGIKCLDDALPYIIPNELVVIGADSGIGKSEMAVQIAKHNAANGKNVYLFYLEGGEEEAIRRMKWIDILGIYYKNYKSFGLEMSYAKWVTNNLKSPIIDQIEDELPDIYEKLYGNRLHIYTRTNQINADAVYNTLMNFWSGEQFNKKIMFNVDLIIIDHLHYFNLEENVRGTEATQITSILKKIKEIPDFHNIPVILFSHLRKKSRDRGMPDQEDFHGSSNIPKIASTAVIISPSASETSNATNIYPTFFRIVKSRYGIKANYCMRTDFNLNERSYGKDYELYGVDSFGKLTDEPIPKYNWPKWAKRMGE